MILEISNDYWNADEVPDYQDVEDFSPSSTSSKSANLRSLLTTFIITA